VLKGITFFIRGGEKVGVVGRTGSGKSTLIQALFRLVEADRGSILIDGIDISKLGLHELRSRLSIIPQEPTLFDGTVRSNIDPLGEHTDSEIWESLEGCQLAEVVHETEKKLDSPVEENGENWSVGQRQLFCLGRALLKKSRILVLDEATASVDAQTDAVIQRTIHKEFANCTVISVAHRIPTVMDSNKVLVLDAGLVKEFDSPTRLLEKQSSLFAALVREYTARSATAANL
jgi:ATP-binding cassette subfamily C (CFTR/MRP) protein 2